MAYKEFISGLQKKLEEKKQELGYSKMAFFEDGATSVDEKELSIIRETNIKYHKTESDVLIGDYIILYQYKGKRDRYADLTAGSYTGSMKKAAGRLCGNRFFLQSNPAENSWNWEL